MNNNNLPIFQKKYNTPKEIQYWTKYLALDVQYVKERRFYHYYNDIPYTRWPFYLCCGLFFTIFYGILFINKYIWAGPFVILSFFSMLYYIYQWFTDLVIESVYFGKYNRKLRSVIVFGFMVFLASEVLLFGGFFRAFFDRFFHTSYVTGGSSLPMGLEVLIWYKKPLYATILLLTSAITFNGTAYCMKWGSYTYAVAYAKFGLLLGCLFLGIQVHEYRHLTFNITDSVYAACFYLLTGFHGMHVIIGLIFLLIQTERLVHMQFTRERHLGFSLAIIYWHFVDIVWFFLFFFVYVFNNATVGSTFDLTPIHF